MPIHNDLPTVVLANFAESHIDFLGRAADPQEREDLINGESFHGDRTLLWGGDPKLLIVSYPIAHAETICRLGFTETRHLAPEHPSAYLSLDILNEKPMLDALVEYAGKARTLVLLPYATTPEFLQLVDVLEKEHGLTVLTPESPKADNLWVRDYVDTKAGFRQLAAHWLPDADRLLPLGMACYDRKRAALAAYWFVSRGETCVVKPDTGESGIGTHVMRPETHTCARQIEDELNDDPFYDNELIIVEKYIHSPTQLSPSPEVYVPALGEGEPYIMYMTQQIFREFGDFCGIEVSKQMYEQAWYPDLERSALTLARGLQNMGYVGHFDLDCIVDEDNQLYLLEVNARRTGGTHVHDFAQHVIGSDYMDKVALLSYEAMDAGGIQAADELLDTVGEFLYPMNGDACRGLVVTITTALRLGRFGCITVAPTIQEALEIQNKVADRVKQYSRRDCGPKSKGFLSSKKPSPFLTRADRLFSKRD